MELRRKDVVKLIDNIREYLDSNNELKSILSIDYEYDGNNLIYGVTNDFLSDFLQTITGNKVNVIGEIEELYECPCCGYKSLTEKYNLEEGTGYCICPFCGWEDDGTTDINQYKSINSGSILDYRKKISNKSTNKWIKNKI